MLKKFLLLLFLIYASTQLTGCGKDHTIEVRYEDKEIIVEIPKAQDFEGFYICKIVSAGICDTDTPPVNCLVDSYLELYADYEDRVSFETTGQSLNSLNPNNGTLGTFPVISAKDLVIADKKLNVAPRNYTFDSSKHDIEEDVSGADINGSKRTDVSLELVDGNAVLLNIKVFDNPVNSNINDIIVDRTLKCEK